MGKDTKADDWEIAAHKLKVNTSTGTAEMSFKVGSVAADIAGLIGCAGAISGSGIPNELSFSLPTVFLNIVSGPFALKDVNGLRGNVIQNKPIKPGELSPLALVKKSKAILFNAALPNSETMEFQISGLWMVKAVLKLRDTFVIP